MLLLHRHRAALAGGHRHAAIAPPPCCSCKRSPPPLSTIVPSAATRSPLSLSAVVLHFFVCDGVLIITRFAYYAL
jgi:hypothetical protein